MKRMKGILALAVAAIGLAVPLTPLMASGDYGCTPSWQVVARNYNDCGNRAMLAPGNDTRVNMFLLLPAGPAAQTAALTYPKSYDDSIFGHSFFDWRLLRQAYYPAESGAQAQDDNYGSRCISNAGGGKAFVAALAASRGLPARERDALAQARRTIAARCAAGGTEANGRSLVAPVVSSAPGRAFLGYLQAADAFYAEDWAGALAGFAGLRTAADPWLAETATYMLARTRLNAAQAASFDEYGSLLQNKTDKAALSDARAAFGDYLKRYPQGRYADSARGLIRRTLWLAGDAVALTRVYEALAAGTPASAADLVEEIDNKLLFGGGATGPAGAAKAADGPLLLAAIDLMMMREAAESGGVVISAEQIAAQESRFAGRADLFGFVQASHAFYVQKDMPKVLRLIPDDARRGSYAPVAFSRQMLRGMALAAVRDRNEAGFWRELMGGTKALYQRPLIELALAMNYERSGRLADVFAPGSPIGEAPVREILLEHVAGADLLRSAARNPQRPRHERDLALFTLLQKQLTYGDYAGFLRDLPLVPADAGTDGGLWNLRGQEQVPVGMFRAGKWSEGYPCPALRATVTTLASDPRDVKARLCLGEFYRFNGFDGYGDGVDAPKRDELGGTQTQFPGRAVMRGDIYAQVIADAKAPAAEKAYALFRAINCYAPSRTNQCGNADVPESRRRAWFQQLKRDHGASPWAQNLRYYW